MWPDGRTTRPLTREQHPIDDDLPDAPALCEPVVVVKRVMDASIEPGHGPFLRRLVEGAKAPRLGCMDRLLLSTASISSSDKGSI
jgi:hypothetical protein